MGSFKIEKIADNIVSPLGLSTSENLNSILGGKSMLTAHQEEFGLPQPFVGSIFNREVMNMEFNKNIIGSDKFTFFENLCILTASYAIKEAQIDPSQKEVVFVLSTTKGNVGCLENSEPDSNCYLAESALKIASYFNNPNTPIVVSNACISGVCAQISAIRLLLSQKYKTAVVIGCDVLSKFIISGFQSFKALSDNLCKPYDQNRQGLNLGEASATIILQRNQNPESDNWYYLNSSIHNDANHISGPSRTGEGSYRVLKDITKEIPFEEIAFINVHGTATPYNDEMESIAIHRAEMDEIPINALKGYYGHTLGAAGVLETILSMKAADKGIIIATKGFDIIGTSYSVNISSKQRDTDKRTIIKILSGFGGTNAGIAYRKGGEK